MMVNNDDDHYHWMLLLLLLLRFPFFSSIFVQKRLRSVFFLILWLLLLLENFPVFWIKIKFMEIFSSQKDFFLVFFPPSNDVLYRLIATKMIMILSPFFSVGHYYYYRLLFELIEFTPKTVFNFRFTTLISNLLLLLFWSLHHCQIVCVCVFAKMIGKKLIDR